MKAGIDRRGVVAAGGLAVAGVLAGSGRPVLGGPSDPRTGRVVGPDAIAARIEPSGVGVNLVEFCTPTPSSQVAPRSLLNFLYHANDSSGRVFANDSRGVIWAIDTKTGVFTKFMDMREQRGSAFQYATANQMGLRSFAFHPNFTQIGKFGYCKFYTLSTETVASAPNGVRLFGGPFPVHHHNVLAEWRVDTATRRQVQSGSRRELLRIAQTKQDHSADQLMFNAFSAFGKPDYGTLYIGVGDGGNFPNNTDPWNQAQDLTSALGKILRIIPKPQADGSAYAIPANNPFVGNPRALGEIWASGLRHPQNLSHDSGGMGTFLCTDIGQAQAEEVNIITRGANCGWPLREGMFVTDRFDDATAYALPADDATHKFTYPVAQYGHDEGNTKRLSAITGGFVYRGKAIPKLLGHYLLGDLVSGRIFHVPVADLKLGRQTPLRRLTLFQGGGPVTLMALAGVNDRVDLRFGRDQAGEIYLLTKQDGKIRRLAAAPG